MNPSHAFSQKRHGVQAKRLNLYKTIQKPTRNCIGCLPSTCHNKLRKLHDFGGTEDTGNRIWELLHQRVDPHQLSCTCNFPLVLFLFPLLPPSCPTWQALWARLPYYRRKSLTTEGNPLLQKGNHLLQKNISYYRKEISYYYRNNKGKSYSKGFMCVVRSLTTGGNPLLCSKGCHYTVCQEISRRGFHFIVRDFLLW